GVPVPGGSAITRHRDDTVVGSDVKQALSQRRLVDSSNVAVVGRSLMTRDSIAGPDLSHHRQAVAIELSREIRSKPHPRVATVVALEEIVRAEVKSVVIVRRDEHR